MYGATIRTRMRASESCLYVTVTVTVTVKIRGMAAGVGVNVNGSPPTSADPNALTSYLRQAVPHFDF